MPESVENFKAGILLSMASLGREFGLHRHTVSARLTVANVDPAGTRGGKPVYRLRDVWPCLVSARQLSEPGDPELMEPKARLDWYRGESERLNLAAKAGELVQIANVRLEMAAIYKNFAGTLETLPDNLEQICGIDAAAIETVRRIVDDLREQLYRQLVDK